MSTSHQIVRSPREHIQTLIEWMAKGVYEKEQIVAMGLLCAVAGENIFLLGPPGTAKSMVANRLKWIFKEAKSFDYLMSRFSTPDEIFGPISIFRLKNEDKYERLVDGYLPSADVIFLDEIWKAGPSIQNTLLTAINEHIFRNGIQTLKLPMKVLIAASNELPPQGEGLEALWDRFLVRMVSNAIENESTFFKMLKDQDSEIQPPEESLLLTDEICTFWQEESRKIEISPKVYDAIKTLRKMLDDAEKENNHRLRYYISDRRWKKAYRLMQTSAYLNGRAEIDLSDYLLLIHCFWNDVETRPRMLEIIVGGLTDTFYKQLDSITKKIRQDIHSEAREQSLTGSFPQETANYVEYQHFYYKVEKYPKGNCFFYKWDYPLLDTDKAKPGIAYFDSKRKGIVVHLLTNHFSVGPLQNEQPITKVSLQKYPGGIMINAIPYAFCKKKQEVILLSNSRLDKLQKAFSDCVFEWRNKIDSLCSTCDNIFLSSADLLLVREMTKEAETKIEELEIKFKNVSLLQ